jgi:hypothetical protein
MSTAKDGAVGNRPRRPSQVLDASASGDDPCQENDDGDDREYEPDPEQEVEGLDEAARKKKDHGNDRDDDEKDIHGEVLPFCPTTQTPVGACGLSRETGGHRSYPYRSRLGSRGTHRLACPVFIWSVYACQKGAKKGVDYPVNAA